MEDWNSQLAGNAYIVELEIIRSIDFFASDSHVREQCKIFENFDNCIFYQYEKMLFNDAKKT